MIFFPSYDAVNTRWPVAVTPDELEPRVVDLDGGAQRHGASAVGRVDHLRGAARRRLAATGGERGVAAQRLRRRRPMRAGRSSRPRSAHAGRDRMLDGRSGGARRM